MTDPRSVGEEHRIPLWVAKAIAVSWACLACGGEIVVGEWVDSLGTVWSQEITIVELNGALYRRSTDTGGGKWSKRLREMPVRGTEQRRFAYSESCCREQFAITANGDLNLYDEEGFIRTATKKWGSETPTSEAASPTAAKSGAILEPDAVLSDGITDAETLAGLYSIAIQAYGFRCDTVSSMTRQFFSQKWDVSCNRLKYSYVVYDRGGAWVVEYDD